MVMGGKFRDPDITNLDNGIPKANENPDADAKRKIWNSLRRGGILTKTGSRAPVGISGFSRRKITEETKNLEYRRCIAVSLVSNKSPRV